jgi:hypothetical protein
MKIEEGYWTLAAGQMIGYPVSVEGAEDVANFAGEYLYNLTGISLPVDSIKSFNGIFTLQRRTD